jgi:periplasmic protein TonB
MFADSFCESTWDQTSRRGWTALASFTLQGLLVGFVLLLPLIYTQGLPTLKLLSGVSPVLAPPAPAPAPPPVGPHTPHVSQSNLNLSGLVAPRSIPDQVAHIEETTPPSPIGRNELGVLGSTGDPRLGTVLGSTGTGGNVLPPPAPKPVSRPVPRTSNLMEAYLVHRVQPAYPSLARAARIQGAVQLRALISKQGTIENLQVTSGHPMLVAAAVEAVRQWRYRPYVLNGDPVEVETQITVNFILSGN